VVADLVALAGQVLQLAGSELGLVEEAVGGIGARQHVEGRGAAEAGILAREGFQDAQAALRIDDPVAAALDVAELPGRGVVEREDHRRGAGG
jgi:hypothetical protein